MDNESKLTIVGWILTTIVLLGFTSCTVSGLYFDHKLAIEKVKYQNKSNQ
jgi:hypothetical protein